MMLEVTYIHGARQSGKTQYVIKKAMASQEEAVIVCMTPGMVRQIKQRLVTIPNSLHITVVHQSQLPYMELPKRILIDNAEFATMETLNATRRSSRHTKIWLTSTPVVFPINRIPSWLTYYANLVTFFNVPILISHGWLPNPHLGTENLEHLKKQMSPKAFTTELLGEYVVESGNDAKD